MGVDFGFLKYFIICVVDSMREGMIIFVRKAVGFGDNFYFNNVLELFYFQYKLQIEQNCIDDILFGKFNLKSIMFQVIDEYVEMCERVVRNVERVVIDEGLYRFVLEF